ncbi:MAG: type restriction enzyme subunit [Bacteroidota bacterium]|jgi:type I restriction enzyme S subunit
MNKKKGNNMTPRLRFEEFREEPVWKERKLYEVLKEHGSKSTGAEEVFSVSVHKGIINQIEHLGRSFSAANTDNYKRVFPGDIVYTKSPTGNFPFGIIKQSKVVKPVIVSPLYGVFTPETEALGCILDAYFESPENTINYLSSIVQKGAKNTINISNETFLSKALFLPSNHEEQQKIAATLTSLDDLITAQTEKIKALQAHKKGLMQQLFPVEGERVPRVRFEEFRDAGEWEERTLGDENIARFVTKKTPLEKLNLDSYISTENLLPDYGGVTPASKLPPSGTFTQFQIGDILISNIRPYLKKVWAAEKEGTASNDIIIIRAVSTINKTFLSFLLKNDCFITYVMGGAKGLKMPRGDKSLIKEYRIGFPEKAEQQKIAATLTSLDDLITAQTQKLEALKAHKKGLMQGLFVEAEGVESRI